MYEKNNDPNFDLLISQSAKPNNIITKPKTLSSVAQSEVLLPSSLSVMCKNDKRNGDSKFNVHDTLNSPNNYSCSNSINSSNSNRRRFSNKLGHKKSKR